MNEHEKTVAKLGIEKIREAIRKTYSPSRDTIKADIVKWNDDTISVTEKFWGNQTYPNGSVVETFSSWFPTSSELEDCDCEDCERNEDGDITGLCKDCLDAFVSDYADTYNQCNF